MKENALQSVAKEREARRKRIVQWTTGIQLKDQQEYSPHEHDRFGFRRLT